MITAQQVKVAADQLTAFTSVVKEQRAALKVANEKLVAAEAQLAQAGTVKTASEAEAACIGQLAKKAAASCLAHGLISSPERAEAFAAAVSDHSKALLALEKFASQSNAAPRTATVVADTKSEPKTADEVWNAHIMGVQARA
jgi:hypothetical protein